MKHYSNPVVKITVYDKDVIMTSGNPNGETFGTDNGVSWDNIGGIGND